MWGKANVDNIRNHKNDKDVVAQVAMRHRQKMQVELEDIMNKYNTLSRVHAQLKSGTSKEILELRQQNEQLTAKLSEMFEIKATNASPELESLQQLVADLQQQLSLSRSNFQALSKHTRGLEQANHRVQVCIFAAYFVNKSDSSLHT
jgi:hypothetical protein